ncbi:MAG TPA: acetamidase/formamidase family protein [Candidatus Dormibacteraeota bacterium]|nr:acetamidase/formamidase family protein [Candidatus Dormibacteraeota bacterium]
MRPKAVPTSSIHKTWNRKLPPALTVRPGEVVFFDALDASGGAIDRNSNTETIANIDFRRLDPLMGPVYVEGAQPGDALQIDVVDLKPYDWGWTGLMRDFGLLASEITEPYLKIWHLNGDEIEFDSGARFRLHPMIGNIGVAPAKDGDYASISPTNAAGNLDCKFLGVGSTLLVPVFNEGALLSASDGHAIQGDGELCGTGIECRMEMTLKLSLIRAANLKAPEIYVADTFPAEEGYRIFMGIGPDLMEAAKDSVRHSIAPLAKAQGISELEAYAMLGLIADLRIHEIVDQPNWVVGCMIPRRLF